MKLCQAKTRSGGKCKRPAMPNGRCRLHGGKSLRGADSPRFKDGRYSAYFQNDLAKKFHEQVTDVDPLSLLPELSVLRTMLGRLIEEISKAKKVKDTQMMALTMLSDNVRKTVATIVKARNDTALTAAEVKYILMRITQLLEKYVPDSDSRRSFIFDLNALLPGNDDDRTLEPSQPAISAG
jgi:hypothetical protein